MNFFEENQDLQFIFNTTNLNDVVSLYEDGFRQADQYAQASRLGRQWADKAATDNEPEAVFHFARATFGGKSNPWLSVQLLDRLLQRSGLSPVQRYEALALRALTTVYKKAVFPVQHYSRRQPAMDGRG